MAIRQKMYCLECAIYLMRCVYQPVELVSDKSEKEDASTPEQRVKQEFSDLNGNLSRLTTFLENPESVEIVGIDQHQLLFLQQELMTDISVRPTR